MYIVFSGSSSIELTRGSYDLSRRAVLYHLRGLSFREFLECAHNIKQPVINFQSIIDEPQRLADSLAGIDKLRKSFQEYLSHGYYPFFLEGITNYAQKLARIVEKTIYEDISSFFIF